MCRNEILVFLRSAHFPCRVKMGSFQKIFSKNLYFLGYCASNLGTLQALTLSGPAFSVVRKARGGSEAQMPKIKVNINQLK